MAAAARVFAATTAAGAWAELSSIAPPFSDSIVENDRNLISLGNFQSCGVIRAGREVGFLSQHGSANVRMSPDAKCNRLASLLDQYGHSLALFATQWTDSPDDCVQEALIRLAGQASWPANDVAWLYRVVKNEAISQARSSDRRRRREQFAARLKPESGESESVIDREALASAVESLESSAREILVAKVWGRLTLEQIATAFSMSKSSAHRRYEEALAALREQLGVPCKTIHKSTTK